jgi:hypothetical protein
LVREVPFQPKITFGANLRVGRDNRHEQRAVSDLPPDQLVPDIAAPQFTLVEPDLDTGCTKGDANAPGLLGTCEA